VVEGGEDGVEMDHETGCTARIPNSGFSEAKIRISDASRERDKKPTQSAQLPKIHIHRRQPRPIQYPPSRLIPQRHFLHRHLQRNRQPILPVPIQIILVIVLIELVLVDSEFAAELVLVVVVVIPRRGGV
jgi:hypothetical protein